MRTITVEFALPDYLLEELDDVSRQLNITRTEALIRAIEGYYIENRPNDLVAADLREALADMKAGRVYPARESLEALRRELGLDANDSQ